MSKELNQTVLEAVTEAANEAAAEYRRVIDHRLSLLVDGQKLEQAHEDMVSMLFQRGYREITGEWPGCGLCGADDHAEYACPNSR